MLHADVARYRTEELLRTAEVRRASRTLVRERPRTQATRRFATAVLALLPIGLRH